MSAARSRQLELIIAALLAAATIAAYARTLNHGFVSFDDPDYVWRNETVMNGLTAQGIAWAFTTFHIANWHPLTWLSHMLDCTLWGVRPGGHHFTNLALHVANALLLLHLLRMMTGSIWRSALVAGLFALHPLHVESVAWVSERKDVLSMFFGLLTLLAYVRYTQQPSVRRYWPMVILFALGLMAKPILVTLPCVMLLLDYWPLQRHLAKESPRPTPPWRWLVIEKLPLLAMSAASSVITAIAQKAGGTVASIEHAPLDARLANAVVAYGMYLWKTIWPTGLACYYPHPGRWPSEKVFISAAALFGITIAAIALYRRRPHVIVGWLWFLGTLVPVIGLVQVGSQAWADRYSYLPHVGLFMMIPWSMPAVTQPTIRRLIAISAAAIVTIAGVCTAIQAGYWFDSKTLYHRAISVTERNWLAHRNLASLLSREGDLDAAIEHFTIAAQLSPNNAPIQLDFGLTLAKAGRLDDAMRCWRTALELQPRFPEAHYNLALAMLERGQVESAMRHLAEAIRCNPDYGEAHHLIGLVHLDHGRLDEAIAHLTEAVRINPRSAAAQRDLDHARALRRGASNPPSPK